MFHSFLTFKNEIYKQHCFKISMLKCYCHANIQVLRVGLRASSDKSPCFPDYLWTVGRKPQPSDQAVLKLLALMPAVGAVEVTVP